MKMKDISEKRIIEKSVFEHIIEFKNKNKNQNEINTSI